MSFIVKELIREMRHVQEKQQQKRKVWYGMVWYGMVWYGMVWCLTVNLRSFLLFAAQQQPLDEK